MLPNEIRSGTPSVVRMLIGRSQTLPSLLLPHSRSVSNSLRRREPGFAPRMHGCGRRLPRCRRSPRLSAGTILARVAAAKSSRSAASIEGSMKGSPAAPTGPAVRRAPHKLAQSAASQIRSPSRRLPLIEAAEADEFIRAAVLAVLTTLTATGRIAREETEAYVLEAV